MALDAVASVLRGSTLLALTKADPRVHYLLADPKRRRRRQFCPGKALS
jgi:hypothetical protein